MAARIWPKYFGLLGSQSDASGANQLTSRVTMEWLTAAIGLTLVALIITATMLMMRHRAKARAVAREAESLNVLSKETRRAFWSSAADHSDTSDSSSPSDSD
jgi:hypothetical protein